MQIRDARTNPSFRDLKRVCHQHLQPQQQLGCLCPYYYVTTAIRTLYSEYTDTYLHIYSLWNGSAIVPLIPPWWPVIYRINMSVPLSPVLLSPYIPVVCLSDMMHWRTWCYSHWACVWVGEWNHSDHCCKIICTKRGSRNGSSYPFYFAIHSKDANVSQFTPNQIRTSWIRFHYVRWCSATSTYCPLIWPGNTNIDRSSGDRVVAEEWL